MAELSLLVKLVGNSASLDRATASGTKGLAAVGGAIGTADDAVKNFAGGVGALGDALGRWAASRRKRRWRDSRRRSGRRGPDRFFAISVHRMRVLR